MGSSFVSAVSFPRCSLWNKIKRSSKPVEMTFELTARCNLNCRHCYINVPAGDTAAMKGELSFEAIRRIVDEARAMGILWCCLTGGEPLLRKDFIDIYLYLQKSGFLTTVFTN